MARFYAIQDASGAFLALCEERRSLDALLFTWTDRWPLSLVILDMEGPVIVGQRVLVTTGGPQ